MGRRVIALVAAALVAIFGVVAMLVYVNGADRRAVINADPQRVYITEKVVPAGTTLAQALESKWIVETVVAAKSKPIGALTEVDDAKKKLVAITDIGLGEFVLAGRFGEKVSAQSALPVPSGMVGISVQLAAPEGVNEFPTPGSHLVLYTTYETKVQATGNAEAPGGQDVKETSVLLADVLVIGVNRTTAPQPGPTAVGGDAPSKADSVVYTLALSPVDAQRVVQGMRATTMYAGLLGEGAKVDPQFRVTLQDMRGK